MARYALLVCLTALFLLGGLGCGGGGSSTESTGVGARPGGAVRVKPKTAPKVTDK